MSLHLIKSGFKPSYKIWTFHGEKAKKRARKEVRQIQPTREYDTGFDRCLENLANGNVPESPHVEAETSRDAETSEEPEENTKKYYEALFASQKPLHVNTDVTQLDAMAFKCHRNLCRDGFDELLVLVGSILPKGHLLPQNFYYSKKLLSDLKMSSQQIHACPKGCMLFREEHANTNYCIHCNSSRYFEVDTNGDGQKRQTTVAKNILRYLPVLPRIQRLFMTEDTAQQMRWAVEGIRPDSGKMIHPSDGTAWKNFVKKYPLKAGDPRSVAIAISTDGFNPYGPKYPGKNMNVYLEPLIDDLLLGWEDRGIRTYDAAKKEHFDMSDVKSFKKGRVVHAPKPIPKTGQETKAELDALQPNPDGNGFLGYGETHQWTHKPCFWKLPYFEFLELPHNIDVMHTEKNIGEAIWSTIVDTEKTKDNIKARIDQEKLCDRPELNMKPPQIEASIAEAVLNVEVANFTTKHYDPNIPTKHNPVLRYNAANNEDVPKLSIFIGLGGKSSGSKPYTTNLHERELIHSYVLNTMVEVKPYIKPPPPNKDDYRRVDPSTRSVDFYQEEGLPGHFTIDLSAVVDNMVVDDEQEEDAVMEEDNEEYEAEDVCAVEDLSLLEAFKAGIDLGPNGPPPGFIDDYWFAEPDDDETCGPITDVDIGY
ncbi:hypothetical protein QYE76_036484 [Lolium multiflorum]|uniref:Uncharacterized protein n=1 Tax=Lolium multiflorum TaxID=4521 RepID=A0AAD8R1U4_LOLMU|nr:hypothetical protein QYE76_036484 [Lolium multiflorum]